MLETLILRENKTKPIKRSLIMKQLLILLAMISLIITAFGDEEKEKPNPNQKYFDYQKEKSAENFNSAINFYQEKIKADSSDFGSNLMIGYLCLSEISRILTLCEENIDQLKPKTQFQYANLLLSLNEFDESIKIYDKINESTPKWSCPWRHKGEAFYKKNDFEKAEEAFKKAIETRITHYDAYVWLARAQKKSGKMEEALKSLETGLEYKFKDIEDPEEEVNPIDEMFLHMILLKENGKSDSEKYNSLKEALKKKAPEDERWKEVE